MSALPTWGVVSLISLIALLLGAVLLIVLEVLTRDDLSPAAKLGWTAALIVTSFFAVIIYFAQGQTGRLGRIASYLLMLGMVASMALVAAALIR